MKISVFQDSVRLFAFLGFFIMGLAVSDAYAANATCDNVLQQRITDEVKRKAAFRQDVMKQTVAPPASVEQVANTPCVSKELQKITNQFADAPNAMLGGLTGSLGSMAGPASGIMNKLFSSGMESLNDASGIMSGMLNFQSQASSVLGDLLGSLGGMDAFSSELCGMMVDMIVKYVQCQFPIQMPQLGGLTGSLNDLLPDGCAGEAARDAIYAVGQSRVMEGLAQPMTSSTNGQITPGTATFRNSGN